MSSIAEEKTWVTRAIFKSVLEECLWPVSVGARRKARAAKSGKSTEVAKKMVKTDSKTGVSKAGTPAGDATPTAGPKKRGRPPKPKVVVPPVSQAVSTAVANATQRLQRQQSQSSPTSSVVGLPKVSAHPGGSPAPHPLSQSVLASNGSSLSSSPAAPLAETGGTKGKAGGGGKKKKKVKRARSRRSSQASSSSSSSESEDERPKKGAGAARPVAVVAKKRRVAVEESEDEFEGNGAGSDVDSSGSEADD